jgi:hypothetical protein
LPAVIVTPAACIRRRCELTEVLVPVDHEFSGWLAVVPSATAARVMESPSAAMRAWLGNSAAPAAVGARTTAVAVALTTRLASRLREIFTAITVSGAGHFAPAWRSNAA